MRDGKLKALFEVADEALLAMSKEELNEFYREYVGDPDTDVAELKSRVAKILARTPRK